MKQTLSLKLGQQLTMTPQLQQAIRLLQLSALDLQQEIQTTLESNPMLEMSEDADAELTPTKAEDEPSEADPADGTSTTPDAADIANAEVDSLDEADVIEQIAQPLTEELPVDSSWEDVYPTSSNLSSGDADFDPLANRSSQQSLNDHLEWQLNLMPLADSDRVIAMALVDAIDNNGMLASPLDEICASLNQQQIDDHLEVEDVEEILKIVQRMDPCGIGARDLSECLGLQLNQLDAQTPWLVEAKHLVDHHLDLLGAKDFNTLKRKTKLNEQDLAEIVVLIQTLNPRPGSAIAEEISDYIIPDVVVRKFEGRWLVELNSDATPQIRINPLYESFAKDSKNSPDKSYLRDNLQEARWFLKSLQTRNDTLLRVAARIVEVQRGFLEYGPEAMKPLILADVADAVELHESTISRVTSRKYMSTPKGVFELKYFFSSHVGTHTGGEVSSTAIRALIQKLTAEEDTKKPLSDNKIAAILKDQNINVARRTVAKYRESLSIPPSNERKQLV